MPHGGGAAGSTALPERELYKKKLFKDRQECTYFLQDFALDSGKRVVVDRAKGNGNNIAFLTSCFGPWVSTLLAHAALLVLEHIPLASKPRVAFIADEGFHGDGLQK